MATEASDRLRSKVDALPMGPGVYLMRDARNEVIYVGKAKDLRARVRSYFQEARDERRLICERIAHVADVDVVVTASETEALLLESNFIKQFRPRYNVNFRDDKSFVSIKINRREPWPRPIVTRRLDDPKALYFGPYASAKAARRTLRTLQDLFPLRKCNISECRRRKRPCVYGEMGKCAAPCCSDVSREQYDALIEEVTLFLRGRADALLERLRAEMEQASQRLEFERAARLRDRVQAIETTLQAQTVASSAADADRDVFGICTVERHVSIAVLFARDGNVRDVASYRFPARLDSEEAIFGSFLTQFYRANRFVPDEILVPVETEDAGLLEAWLSEKKGRRVHIMCPKRGHKRRLVELAIRNAGEAERAATTDEEKRRLEMESLQRLLGLGRLPRGIECFDISTTQGREAVGSMVVFRDGEPDKSAYRHYRIRSVEGQDDFAMMREVLTRRYAKVGEGGEGPPDLVLVDGGKGQLGVALAVLGEQGVEGCDVAALAKARTAGGVETKHERVYLPGREEPVEVPADSYGFRLVTRVRDEAHRFAVRYHRSLRERASVESPLEEVPGVGPVLSKRLVEHFGGLNKLRGATVEELAEVRGISKRLAQAIVEHLAGG